MIQKYLSNNVNHKGERYERLSEKPIPAQHTIQIQSSLSPHTQNLIQTFSLIFLTFQQTINPLLVRKAHKVSEENDAQFLSSTTVFTTEVVRVVLCCVFLCIHYGSIRSFYTELRSAFLHKKSESLKVCVPALIYVVQNNLFFFALKRVDATLFSITYQLRILTTALLSKILLGRIFTKMQWGALFISFFGVVLVQISSTVHASHSDKKQADNFIGLATVIVMCWTSAFAGVYLEKVLKKSSCDILLQNVRLSVITLPFTVITMAHDRQIIQNYGLFYGWSYFVWIVVFSSAVGGIVVAAVMKYADNIQKSYCQSVALGGTALISIFVGDSHFSLILIVGVALVIASIFLYTLNSPTQQFKLTTHNEVTLERNETEDECTQALLSESNINCENEEKSKNIEK